MTPPQERFAHPVSGHAYRPVTRLLTIVIALATLGYGLSVGLTRGHLEGPLAFMLVTAGLIMAVAAWYIVTGQTTIDANGVRQDWIMAKSYGWGEIRSARLVKLPLATRLMLNTGRPPFKVIQAGTPEIEAAFREIVAYYRAQAQR